MSEPSIIEFLQAVNPAMATQLTRERLQLIMNAKAAGSYCPKCECWDCKRRMEAPALIKNQHLSVRTKNALNKAGLHTVVDALAWSDQELLSLRHFGNKSLEELRSLVRKGDAE